jgi:hypothetical protein
LRAGISNAAVPEVAEIRVGEEVGSDHAIDPLLDVDSETARREQRKKGTLARRWFEPAVNLNMRGLLASDLV